MLYRDGVQPALIEFEGGIDVFDMHCEALLDGFRLTPQVVASGDQLKAFAFEFLDRQIDPITVGGEPLDHRRGLL